nr:TerB family tellurite resistance protein [Campylobacter sp. RM16190]
MLGVAKAEFENAKNEIDSAINDIKNGDKILKEKIKILISLMRIDGKIEDEEQEYIANFITKSNFASSDEMELIGYLGNNEKMDINYALFKTDPQEALALIIDLIALSSVDEKIHITEKMFIKNIAKMINFNENDALELIEQTKQNI